MYMGNFPEHMAIFPQLLYEIIRKCYNILSKRSVKEGNYDTQIQRKDSYRIFMYKVWMQIQQPGCLQEKS
jgi:hypothetical protein